MHLHGRRETMLLLPCPIIPKPLVFNSQTLRKWFESRLLEGEDETHLLRSRSGSRNHTLRQRAFFGSIFSSNSKLHSRLSKGCVPNVKNRLTSDITLG